MDPPPPKLVKGSALVFVFIALFVLVATFSPGGRCSKKPPTSGGIPEVTAAWEVDQIVKADNAKKPERDPRLGNPTPVNPPHAEPKTVASPAPKDAAPGAAPAFGGCGARPAASEHAD